LALVAASLAGAGYVRHQWHAALAALAADRPSEARTRLPVCLFVWPRDPEVHRLAARAARLSGDPQAAEDHLNECLKLNGGATEAVQLEFLLLRVQTGNVDEVSPTLIDCVEKGHPESPIILETLAQAYMHRHRYKPMLACLTRWVEICPDTAKAYQWRGWVLERLNHSKEAAADYNRALELDPDIVPVRLRLAEMYMEDSNPPAALPHLEAVSRRVPDRPEVLARLGQCRLLQGQPEEARRLLEAAVANLPNDPPLLVSLAKLDLQEGRPAEAEQWLRRALRVDPTDTESRYTLVASLRAQGRTEEAATALAESEKTAARMKRFYHFLQEEAERPSNDPDALCEVGEVFLSVGKGTLGVYWLNKALERDPGHQRALQALAEYYEKKGDRDRADGYRRLIQPDTKNVPP
jgi:predicted Zn-dependent protease